MTVDGREPFDKNVESIAELYGSIIELALKEFALELRAAEVAATKDMEADMND